MVDCNPSWMECFTEFVIKQECYDSEDLASLTKPSEQEYIEVLSEPSTKCGEVFWAHGGGFTLVCAICSNPFRNFELFGGHIRDFHLNPNSDVDSNYAEELRTDSHNDPLCLSPKTANKISIQEESSNRHVEIKVEVMRTFPENMFGKVQQDEDNQNETIVAVNSAESTDQTRPFTCDLCDCTYTHHRSYLAHVRTHGLLINTIKTKSTHQISENMANNCRTTFPVSETRARATDEDSTQQSFESESEIDSMLDADNISKKDTYACIICKRKYKHKRSLLSHIQTSHGEQVTDTIRQPASDSPNRLDDTSEDKCEKPLRKPYQENRCIICGRVYKYRKSLRSHIRNEHYENTFQDPVDETVCKYCDKLCSSKYVLEAHILNDHPSDKKYVCPLCQKTFPSPSARQKHIRIHTGERPFKCPHCPRAFSTRSTRTMHIRSHLQIKNHHCSFCDKAFISKNVRDRHEMMHTGEKPHQCEECGKRYHTSGKLTEHQRRHKNIKNFECDVCSKTFYSSTILKDHKMGHSSDRPFSCDVCGQKFPRKRALRVHEQLHSDVKKYVCNTCGKAFAQCAGLYSHKKSHGEIK